MPRHRVGEHEYTHSCTIQFLLHGQSYVRCALAHARVRLEGSVRATRRPSSPDPRACPAITVRSSGRRRAPGPAADGKPQLRECPDEHQPRGIMPHRSPAFMEGPTAGPRIARRHPPPSAATAPTLVSAHAHPMRAALGNRHVNPDSAQRGRQSHTNVSPAHSHREDRSGPPDGHLRGSPCATAARL